MFSQWMRLEQIKVAQNVQMLLNLSESKDYSILNALFISNDMFSPQTFIFAPPPKKKENQFSTIEAKTKTNVI